MEINLNNLQILVLQSVALNGKSKNLVVSRSHKTGFPSCFVYMLESQRSGLQWQWRTTYVEKVRESRERNDSPPLFFHRLTAEVMTQIKVCLLASRSSLKICVIHAHYLDQSHVVFCLVVQMKTMPSVKVLVSAWPWMVFRTVIFYYTFCISLTLCKHITWFWVFS